MVSAVAIRFHGRHTEVEVPSVDDNLTIPIVAAAVMAAALAWVPALAV